MSRSNDLHGFWKEPKKPSASKQKRKSKSKRRQQVRKSKIVLAREFALRYFKRGSAYTPNIMLGILISKEMDWPQCENKNEVRRHIRLFMDKAIKSKSPTVIKTDKQFYRSKGWMTVRYQALVNCGASCQCCGGTASDGLKIHVDHIKPRSKFPELALDLDNLQVMCECCNGGKDNWDDTNWRNHFESI